MKEFDDIQNAYMRNMFAREGQTTEVMVLYRALADKTVTDKSGNTLYHLAARFWDDEAIGYLTAEGVKARPNDYDDTPLHTLVKSPYGNDILNFEKKSTAIYRCTQQLLGAGVNPKKKNESGQIAYLEAGKHLMYPFIQAMADNGVKMNAIGEENKNLLHLITATLYHRKSIQGVPELAYKTIKILLDSGSIDPEDTDLFGTTPLTYAQRSGVKEIAALLSGEEGCAPTGGMTVSQAVLNRDMEVLETLARTRADLNELSEAKRTPLMYACEYPNLEAVKLLLREGADVNYKAGETGCTAVYYLLTQATANLNRGVAGGQEPKVMVKILQALVDGGLDIDAPVDAAGHTALNLLCSLGYLCRLNNRLAEELIDAGCSVDLPDLEGCTPLMTFALKGNEQEHNIAELLLDHHADPAAVDKYGNTALMYAAANPNQASGKLIAELLLEAGDPTTERTNNEGQTALDIAVKAGNEAVVKLLLNHM